MALKKSSGIVFSFCGFSKILQFVGRFHSIFLSMRGMIVISPFLPTALENFWMSSGYSMQM